MATMKILIAGSGGQGVMVMGQMIAKSAILEGKQVTYLPSYGPEMRGGMVYGEVRQSVSGGRTSTSKTKP